jgi:aminomethyltransferase
MESLKRTPLYHVQHERGARFVPFCGYEMPVQFAGLMQEHQAVRNAVGLFDVSHMGEVVVEGPEALEALQWVVTNDVSKLSNGQALYTVMCTAQGGIIDDLIVYKEKDHRYFLCVNAGRRSEDVAHLKQEVARFNAVCTDVSDSWAQLALQGPLSVKVLSALTSVDVASLGSFCFVDAQVGSVEGVRIARTGYTGEMGFELYCAAQHADTLWRAIEKAGAAHGLALCGLGCRDTLRLEMKYPLYGNDIDLEHTPLEAGLGWVVKFQKGDFLGRDALLKQKEQGVSRKWVGFKMRERGIPRHGYEVAHEGAVVGVVTSGTHSPSLAEPLGTAYVPVALSTVGSTFHVVIRDKHVLAEVVKTPFYERREAP